jgi:DNA mismatch repair protein MutL
MAIHLLTDQTIGKIAAGEVIERPASIVKEVLENSIDSGASQIGISIIEGGVREIRVVDNGCGIPAAELPLAVHRHATSKLGDFGDLNSVATLGFRGEALASIAAVSRLQIRSGVAGNAAVLVAEFGSAPHVQATSGAQGTTVTVRDLFENVPARRKFLRQPSTEATAIQRLVAAYASSRPEIAFRLEVDGRLIFATAGDKSVNGAATTIFGSDVGHAILEFAEVDEFARVPGIAASGWITGPTVTRSHRQQMYFFVNGRLIQHRTLNFVVEECFHTLLMVGRHPLAMIRIAIEPELVDVNVHPTKAEVRFADDRAVARAVQRAVHSALAGAPVDDLPRVSFAIPAAQPAQPIQPTLMQSPARGPDQSGESAYTSTRATPGSVPMLRVLGQVGASYIIAEGPEGLYLIDQHAAHERVMYEKIRSQMTGRNTETQQLLDPMVIDLDPHEAEVMSRSLEEMNQIGFELEPFGDQSFTLRAIPAMMTGVDLRERFHLILRELADGGVGESWLDSVAISAACHTSIRAGQVLSIAEMRELVNQLEQTEHPRACGHGRPTMLLMSQIDLEKQFSRR